MKILHIHTQLVSGGIEAVVCGLANETSKHEDVSVCTIFQPTDDDVFYKRLQSSVHKFDCGKSEKGFSLREIFKICRLIWKGKYDVVHLHGAFQYYFLSVLLWHRKVKFFYTIHSDAAMENMSTTSLLRPFKAFCFRKGWVRPVTISPASRLSFHKLYGCDSALIPNGVSAPVLDATNKVVSKYRLTPYTKVFVHPARISTAKNQLVLCQAFRDLISEGHDVVLLIAGTSEEKELFEQLKPYFCDRIVYLGERRDVIDLLAQSDAFCLPSLWEGLPVSLLEALSVSCVPICSPVGGIVDVIRDGVNGLLSQSSSLEDYKFALKRFLQFDERQIVGLKHHCQQSFVPYSIDTCCNSYLIEYNK